MIWFIIPGVIIAFLFWTGVAFAAGHKAGYLEAQKDLDDLIKLDEHRGTLH